MQKCKASLILYIFIPNSVPLKNNLFDFAVLVVVVVYFPYCLNSAGLRLVGMFLFFAWNRMFHGPSYLGSWFRTVYIKWVSNIDIIYPYKVML